MRVYFRVDASVEMGTGHVMRCMSLADSLREKGIDAVFMSREHPGHLCDTLASQGVAVRRLSSTEKRDNVDSDLAHASWLGTSQKQDQSQTDHLMQDADPKTDWLVVDHYALDRRWETPLRKRVHRILVIDDLADRDHDCDLLVDVNLQDRMDTRYQSRVPSTCKLLLGPRYALLRKEFSEMRKKMDLRPSPAHRLFIFFGGSDPQNRTGIALEALRLLDRRDLTVDVVIGASNPARKELETQCRSLKGVRCHVDVHNMAERMAQADLALGAGGITTWERACMGLPAIALPIVENQISILDGAEKAGLLVKVTSSQFTAAQLADRLGKLLKQPEALAQMSAKGKALVDGEGATRVAALIQ